MTRVENIRRSFERFTNDEGLYRLLDEILYTVDIEGTVASAREQLHKIAQESLLKCEYLGETGDRIQQEFVHLLEDSLSMVYPAVKLQLYENDILLKNVLRNFISYVVRNDRYIYDFYAGSHKRELIERLFYSIQRAVISVLRADRLDRFVEQAFEGVKLTEPEKEEKKALEERLGRIHYSIIVALCDDLESKCDKALAVVEQCVRSAFNSVIEKLFHVEKAADSLREFYNTSGKWINKVFGEDSISYIGDAIEQLEEAIYWVAPVEEIN